MIATKYVFRIAVAATAFLIGHSAYAGAMYAISYFEPEEFECTAAIAPVGDAIEPVEELIEPPFPDEAPVATQLDFEWGGEYYLVDEALLKGFPGFEYFEIATSHKGVPSASMGVVHTKQDHKFIWFSRHDDRLAFATESVGGVSYQFDGTYGPDMEGDGNGWAIRGNFKKLKTGKIVSQMYVTFYPGGDC